MVLLIFIQLIWMFKSFHSCTVILIRNQVGQIGSEQFLGQCYMYKSSVHVKKCWNSQKGKFLQYLGNIEFHIDKLYNAGQNSACVSFEGLC